MPWREADAAEAAPGFLPGHMGQRIGAGVYVVRFRDAAGCSRYVERLERRDDGGLRPIFCNELLGALVLPEAAAQKLAAALAGRGAEAVPYAEAGDCLAADLLLLARLVARGDPQRFHVTSTRGTCCRWLSGVDLSDAVLPLRFDAVEPAGALAVTARDLMKWLEPLRDLLPCVRFQAVESVAAMAWPATRRGRCAAAAPA